MTMNPASPGRRLLPIVAVLAVPVSVGAAWCVAAGAGATATGGPADLPLRGGPLAPPLFLFALLITGAAIARRPGRAGAAGLAVVGLIATMFLVAGTFNIATDLEAARAAGIPEAAVRINIYGVIYPVAILLLGHVAGEALRRRRAAAVPAAG